MIIWSLMSDIPDTLKDGRELLLWSKDGSGAYRWLDGKYGRTWYGAMGEPIASDGIEPTHCAEINPPSDAATDDVGSPT